MSAPATLYTWDLATLGIGSPTADSNARAIPNVRDLGFDHKTGRFIQAHGDVVLTTGLNAIRQAVNIALLTFLGEWFLDRTKGMAIFELILVKSPSLPAIRAEVRARILAVAGIRSVTSLTLDFNKSTRKLSIAWTADTDEGELDGITLLKSP